MYQKACQHALIMDGRVKGYGNGMRVNDGLQGEVEVETV